MNIILRTVCYCKSRNTYKINDNSSEKLHVELKAKEKQKQNQTNKKTSNKIKDLKRLQGKGIPDDSFTK